MINATFDVEFGKIRRIHASAKYPSEQMGNVFYDSEIVPNLRFADELPKKLQCLHAVVAFRASCVLLSRDILGGKPLYYDSGGVSSFSSSLKNAVEVLPGEIVKMDYEGNILERKRYKFEDVIKKEEESLEQIEEEIIDGIMSFKPKNCCIAFSGGIDSALLAAIYDLPLLSVTASNIEEEWIRKVAKMISADVEIMKLDEKIVKEAIPEIVRIIETSNFLQLSIAVPLHFTMMFAKENGFDELMTGQGADELFGGYKKYERFQGSTLEEVLMEDLKSIGEKNLVRDTKLSYHNEVKLILPYLNWKVVRNSISIPPEMKIKKSEDKVVRKYFLRRIAQKFLPEEIVWKEKKAIQYSTGIVKILRKLCCLQTGRGLGF